MNLYGANGEFGFTSEAGRRPFLQVDGEGLGFYIIDNPLGKRAVPLRLGSREFLWCEMRMNL